MNQEQKTEKENNEPVYNIDDLIMIENPQVWSAFGKMLKSEKLTEPKYSFGKGTRNQQEKVFSTKKQAKTMFLCKNSPGPVYLPQYKTILKNLPQYSIPQHGSNQTQKNSLTNTIKYNYYLHDDTQFQPQDAKYSTYKNPRLSKFPLEQRFKDLKGNFVLGPIYDQGLDEKIKYKRPPSYTMGFKRIKPNGNLLAKPQGTSVNIGPNTYKPKFSFLSNHQSHPQYSIGKERKEQLKKKYNLTNETYENYRSIGKQMRSQKRSESMTKFGKDKRGKSAVVMRQDMAQQPIRLQLPHAHY